MGTKNCVIKNKNFPHYYKKKSQRNENKNTNKDMLRTHLFLFGTEHFLHQNTPQRK
jgi:hypothetical protein